MEKLVEVAIDAQLAVLEFQIDAVVGGVERVPHGDPSKDHDPRVGEEGEKLTGEEQERRTAEGEPDGRSRLQVRDSGHGEDAQKGSAEIARVGPQRGSLL